MRAYSLFALVACGLLAGGCSSDDESTERRGCAWLSVSEISSSLSEEPPTVIVLDAEGSPLCDARVVARKYSSEIPLSPSPSECHRFELPLEGGDYEVRVEKEGYRAFFEPDVRVSLSSCTGPSSDDVVARLETLTPGCDGTFASSFEVDLRDASGRARCDARVVVRDGAFVEALQAVPKVDGTCDWRGVFERPGTYEVTISGAYGERTVVLPAVTVTQAPGACHVTPSKIEATLEALPPNCDDDVTESLVVVVHNASGAEVCNATVTVRDGDFSATLRRSDDSGPCTWSGLPERSGVYEVTVDKRGYEPFVLEGVVVGHDGCHVKTAFVDARLELAKAPPASLTGG